MASWTVLWWDNWRVGRFYGGVTGELDGFIVG